MDSQVLLFVLAALLAFPIEKANGSCCTTSAGGTVAGCPVTGRRFEQYTGTSQTWEEAWDVCAANGGKLAHISTEAIRAWMQSKMDSGALSKTNCWVGAKRDAVTTWTGAFWANSKTATSGTVIVNGYPTFSNYEGNPGVATKVYVYYEGGTPEFDDAYDNTRYSCSICEFICAACNSAEFCSTSAGGFLFKYSCLMNEV